MTGFKSKRQAAQPEQQAEPCIGKDPRCPCQDGDACHYKDCGNTKARPVAQPEQEPVAWAVQGCSKMWRDEFAEIDAKAEAKRIGGTCVAYALYTTPPKQQAEPVAWYHDDFDTLELSRVQRVGWKPLYTTPPAAQRKPLTATVIVNMMPSQIPSEYDGPLMEFARAIEAAHNIKEQP